jgi:nitrite reductase/ring-hydroxylating ferredoxin subunit
VGRAEEVIPRHIVQTQLLGQELAVWRDDAGAVNAWANRCPHRGVRLSIGINTGSELRCRYHGWRFASGTGQCTFIPAHPSQKPASTLHAAPYSAAERHGYVWVNLGRKVELPLVPLAADGATTLRSIFVDAPAGAVAQYLLRGYRIDATTVATVASHDAFTLTAEASAARAMFLLQPVTESQTVIHGTLCARAVVERIAVLRYHNTQLSALRDALQPGPAVR